MLYVLNVISIQIVSICGSSKSGRLLICQVKFQVLSHFERCPRFDKKWCVKKIPVVVNHFKIINNCEKSFMFT